MPDELTPPQGSPTEGVTLEQVQAIVEKTVQGILPDITNQINGVATKSRKAIDEVRQQSESSQTELLESLKGLISPKMESEESSSANTPTPTDSHNGENDQLKSIRVQVAKAKREQEQRIKDLEARYEASEQKNLRLQASQDFNRAVSDRVIDPGGLLILAEKSGLLKQDGSEFQVLKGKDEYTGDPIYAPITESVDLLVKQFPYLEKARPGNGAGASTGEPIPPKQEQTPEQMVESSLREKGLL